MTPRVVQLPLPRTVSAPDFFRAFGTSAPHALWQSSDSKSSLPTRSTHASGRYTIAAFAPRRIFSLLGDTLRITRGGRLELEERVPLELDPMEIIRGRFEEERPATLGTLAHLPFPGGLIGFVAYDAGRHFERIVGSASSDTEPTIFLLETACYIVFDKVDSTATLVSFPELAPADEVSRAEEVLRTLRPRNREDSAHDIPPIDWESKFSPAEFCGIVERALEYIRAGDIFQVVLANTYRSALRVDPLDAYCFLGRHNPSPYHSLVSFGSGTYVSASPECLLRGSKTERGLAVRMRLVAGTYPKDASSTDQKALLGADRKERAEHLMLVDHARNDIGRIAEIGSVEVADLFSVETYADVHHLVSQVGGIVRPEESLFSALRSCFPIATLTGTPKIRAMEIIAELEGASRGLFGGAVVALGYDDSIDSAVAIRGLVTNEQGTRIQAGAGIVYDSQPEREYDECLWKARAVMAAADRCRLL